MATYNSNEGQSLCDICLIVYGTLDKLVQLCNDNDLNINSYVPNGTPITYSNTNTPTGNYATGYGVYNTDITYITSQPQNANLYTTLPGTLYVGTSGTITSYRWQILSGSVWNNLTNVAPYSNVNTDTLLITDPSTSLSNSEYRCVLVTGDGNTLVTNLAKITVIVMPAISIPSTSNSIEWGNASISATTTGTIDTYQWQYSTNYGSTWTGITNVTYPLGITPSLAATITGYDTSVINITNTYRTMNGWYFRCIVTDIYDNQIVSNISDFSTTNYPSILEEYHDVVYESGDTLTNLQVNALDQLYSDFTGVTNVDYPTANILSLFTGIYPILNSSAGTQRLNFVNAVRDDLNFSGTVTHNSSGLNMGANGIADTTVAASNFATDNWHFSIYSNTSSPTPGTLFMNAGSNIKILLSGTNTVGNTNSSTPIGEAISAPNGLMMLNRTSSTDSSMYIYDNEYTSTSVSIGTNPTNNFQVGANTNLHPFICTFATVGKSLTDDDQTLLYNALNAFQTTLSRNI